MHVRLLALGTIAALCAYGCAQGSAPVPPATGGSSASIARPNLAHALSQPGIELFNLPNGGGSWPDYMFPGPVARCGSPSSTETSSGASRWTGRSRTSPSPAAMRKASRKAATATSGLPNLAINGSYA